jgi:hypothetical protein
MDQPVPPWYGLRMRTKLLGIAGAVALGTAGTAGFSCSDPDNDPDWSAGEAPLTAGARVSRSLPTDPDSDRDLAPKATLFFSGDPLAPQAGGLSLRPPTACG